MTKLVARTLSFTFAPALIALVGIGGSGLYAIEPQDVPAKPTEAATPAKSLADSTGAHGSKSKVAKHHKHHHHHKGEAGRKST